VIRVSEVETVVLGLLLLAGALAIPWERLPPVQTRVSSRKRFGFERALLSVVIAAFAMGLLVVPLDSRWVSIDATLLILGLILVLVMVPRVLNRTIRVRLISPERLDAQALIREALHSEGIPDSEAIRSGATVHELSGGLTVWNPFDMEDEEGGWQQMINIHGVTETTRSMAVRIANAIRVQAAKRGARHELLAFGKLAAARDES